jgi:Protein of unknown function (DUF1579)
MLRRQVLVSLFSLCCLAPVSAQAAPAPAAQLQKLAPLVGNWTGTGEMNEPTGAKTKWTAHGTYRWALDGHFLREDFAVTFEGMPTAVVMHGYLGWDRENQHYVHLMVSSSGQANLNRMEVGNDGSMTLLALRRQGPMHYAERSVFQVQGNRLRHTVDLLMPEGASLAMVDGTFQRTDKSFDGAFDTPALMGGKPHADIARLCRSAGVYAVEGEMVMAPGQPKMTITGTDTFRALFGGSVLHGHTEGVAEGMPGKYLGEVFWAHDEARNRLLGVYVSNMGEVMSMDAWWTADGQLSALASGVFQGQPMAQRTLLQFDAAGAAVAAASHSLTGTAAPFESFRATYTRQK